jgi:hypothetical protein
VQVIAVHYNNNANYLLVECSIGQLYIWDLGTSHLEGILSRQDCLHLFDGKDADSIYCGGEDLFGTYGGDPLVREKHRELSAKQLVDSSSLCFGEDIAPNVQVTAHQLFHLVPFLYIFYFI